MELEAGMESPELYDFVMKNIENDQYKVMMIVKSLVVKIQNGLTL